MWYCLRGNTETFVKSLKLQFPFKLLENLILSRIFCIVIEIVIFWANHTSLFGLKCCFKHKVLTPLQTVLGWKPASLILGQSVEKPRGYNGEWSPSGGSSSTQWSPSRVYWRPPSARPSAKNHRLSQAERKPQCFTTCSLTGQVQRTYENVYFFVVHW